MGTCKYCDHEAVTADSLCVMHWDEVWNTYQAQVMDRFMAAPTRTETRIAVPTVVDVDSCWIATDIGDDTPKYDGYVWADETETEWLWHKLDWKTGSAA